MLVINVVRYFSWIFTPSMPPSTLNPLAITHALSEALAITSVLSLATTYTSMSFAPSLTPATPPQIVCQVGLMIQRILNEGVFPLHLICKRVADTSHCVYVQNGSGFETL
ncbi:hypothetical protein QYM36_010041 [Artemia franciscana]|uniref:Uncharacterized protein n=1 Tax=Artemia franciscana TaxID=6661 RepID=A0AA88L7A4_ARTSF|nr:hypothetical protein QYM36_010041 [Artemia franciscana]